MNPKSPEEYLERGWLYYSRQKFDKAESDIRQVLQADPADIEAWYALGLTLKAQGNTDKAIEAFAKVDQSTAYLDDRQRAMIILRLAHGQVNLIRTGNWNLENEIWKTKQ